MMDLLKRFEEDSLDDEGVGGDGDDGDDLERRLAGIDLGEFCYSSLSLVARAPNNTYRRECFYG